MKQLLTSTFTKCSKISYSPNLNSKNILFIHSIFFHSRDISFYYFIQKKVKKSFFSAGFFTNKRTKLKEIVQDENIKRHKIKMLPRIVTNFQFLLILLLSIASMCYAQDNAQLTISRSLRRCYQDRNIFERDNRLPMTPQMLIELIRKVEDHPTFTLDMRQLATSMLFAFKQDGIRRKY